MALVSAYVSCVTLPLITWSFTNRQICARGQIPVTYVWNLDFCVLHHLIGSLNYYEHLLIPLSAKYIISQVQDSNSQSYKEDLGSICVIIMQIWVINHWSRCYELISKVSLTSEANILLIRFLSDLCAIKGKLRLERKKNIPQ